METGIWIGIIGIVLACGSIIYAFISSKKSSKDITQVQKNLAETTQLMVKNFDEIKEPLLQNASQGQKEKVENAYINLTTGITEIFKDTPSVAETLASIQTIGNYMGPGSERTGSQM